MSRSSFSKVPSQQRPLRSMLAVLWLAAWGLLGGALLWRAGDTARTDAAANSSSTVSGVETTPVSYQPIEAVQVGDRVLTQATTSIHAPEAEPSSASSLDLDAEPVDPDTWRRVELRPVSDDPGRVEIVLLRPTWWLEARDVRLGGRITLHMPELGLSGPCRVEAIGPCPPIEPGPGRVVTGAFNRHGARVLDLHLEGEPAPIGTTASHPFYSLDRGAFVSAGDLAVGERLERLDGRPARVARLEFRPDRQRVFNLEVHGEHVYRVADAGDLVHNACPGSSKQFGKKWGQHKKDYPHMKSHHEYRELADRIYDDHSLPHYTYPPDAPHYPGETHKVSGEDLLRLDEHGEFRSLYPGAKSTYPDGFPPPTTSSGFSQW